jgi:phosphoglycolate phosphatase
MTSPRIVVFDLDGTLEDTAPDLINALNFVLDREGLPPVPLHAARNMIAAARRLIERGLEVDGRAISVPDITRLFRLHRLLRGPYRFASRPFEGLESARRTVGARISFRGLHQQAGMAVEAARPAGLSSRFAAICGADTSGLKPDP